MGVCEGIKCFFVVDDVDIVINVDINGKVFVDGVNLNFGWRVL